MKKLFILCGEAFSGKSTLAKIISKKYKANIVGRDEIYFATEKILALENTPDEDDDSLWNNLWPVTLQGVKNQLMSNNSVVVDDNCFHLSQRNELRSIGEKFGAKVLLIFLDTPIEILNKRKQENKVNKTRHDVPSEWMEDDRNKFERPTDDENALLYKEGGDIDEFINELEKQF